MMIKKMRYEKWQRQTALFLGSQTISLFGSSLVQYAIFWYLTLETKSGFIMTLSTLFGFLPTFFISPFAGVWADRYNRKRLIVLSDGITALSTLVLFLLFLAGRRSIWILLATSAIRAFGAGIQMPAVGAILPQIVPEKELTRINGLNGSIQAVVMLVSPMISGALYQFAPMEGIFLIDIVTAALAIAILVLLLQVPTHEKASQEQVSAYLQDMRLGFRYIQNHAFIKRLFLYFSLAFFMAAPVSFLSPLQVARSFGDEVWRLTAIEIAFSIGMIGGGPDRDQPDPARCGPLVLDLRSRYGGCGCHAAHFQYACDDTAAGKGRRGLSGPGFWCPVDDLKRFHASGYPGLWTFGGPGLDRVAIDRYRCPAGCPGGVPA